MKCFYHNDLDGRCAGFLVKLNFSHCEMLEIDYSDVFPWDIIKRSESVWLVDYSLKPEEMERLVNSCFEVIWIDHHKTAIDQIYAHHRNTKDLLGRRKVGTAACVLVYDYIYTQNLRQNIYPRFVKLLGDYDIWDHEDPDVLPFQYGMKLQYDTSPDNVSFWKSLYNPNVVNNIIQDGKICMRYQQVQDQEYVKFCAFKTVIEVDDQIYIAIAANLLLTNSKLFKSVYNPNEHDLMIAFGIVNNQWKVSLYTDKPIVDVSEIAKHFGGGGHRGAAGFMTRSLPFSTRG